MEVTISVNISEYLAEKIGRDRYQGLRVERTDCEDVCVSGYTKCNRDEHVKLAVLSIEWVGAVPPYFRIATRILIKLIKYLQLFC